jgi:hypothetical protein
MQGKFLERNGNLNHADRYIEKYLPEELLNSGKVKFLRTEYFQQDFAELFGQYLDVSVIPQNEYAGRVNASRNFLPQHILNALHSNQKVYIKCPKWRDVEALAYSETSA